MEIFPNWTVFPIVFLLIVLTFLLNRLFIRPLGKTLEERDRLITGAQREAEEIRRASQEKTLEFERKLREARREADLQTAHVKAEAIGEKNQLVSSQRETTEKMLREARTEIRAKTEEARQTLESQAKVFARHIASRILRRPVQRRGSTTA
jgi:F-type H+-transporting ATPase subunit b